MRNSFRLPLILILLLVAPILIAISPVPLLANPIPIPADNLWSLNLNAEPLPDFLVWEADGAIDVLLGVGDQIVQVRDGEIVGRSESFNGAVTALLRADIIDDERPEFLVAVKEDSLNLIHILDGEDFSNLQTIVVGWDWVLEDDPDSVEQAYQHWSEQTDALYWAGGERGVLLIGKGSLYGSTYGTAYGAHREGSIHRYSVSDQVMIDSTLSGYNQHWFNFDDNLIIGSSRWWGQGCGWFSGESFANLQFIHPDFNRGSSVRLQEGLFDGHENWYIGTSASIGFRQSNDSSLFAASVNGHQMDGQPVARLHIGSIPSLDSLTSIDLEFRAISSFVPIQNQENDHLQPYLMCIEEDGTTRLLSTSTLSLLAQEYISPVGGIGVKCEDFDGDGRAELVGIRGNRLIAVRLRQLSAPSASGPVSATSFALLNCFPNPFNSSTTISYSLPHPGRYAIEVIDIQGRLVTRLSDGWHEAGSYREVWSAQNQASGAFLIRVGTESGEFVVTKSFLQK